ncbi:MAG TPA: glycosyltransferase family 4 protein [Candidatus Methylomirabilis sp.]|nr:glycosyltransferase family 4 protein [Candidatus Methylomirabilis sp.]
MADVLLTVSGLVAPDTAAQVAHDARPRADYLELARALPADLMDYGTARRHGGTLGRLLGLVGGPDVMLAWACFSRRRRYRAIFTDGEQVGIPLAWFSKFCALRRPRPRHLMITHTLAVRKKMLFLDWLGVHSHIDRFLVYSTWQKRFIENRWHIPPDRVTHIPFMVDTEFFAPERVSSTNTGDPPMICSVGIEGRDYATLLKAVHGLDVRVIVAAASQWSKRADPIWNHEVPANVSVRRYSQAELRQVYSDSRFMVLPLHRVNFQAGVTAILEAMAMGRAVICSRTPGQTDVIVDRETGLYVPASDPPALRSAIRHLLAHPEEADRMGRAGRRLVEETMSLDRYVRRLHRYVRHATADRGAPSPDDGPLEP